MFSISTYLDFDIIRVQKLQEEKQPAAIEDRCPDVIVSESQNANDANDNRLKGQEGSVDAEGKQLHQLRSASMLLKHNLIRGILEQIRANL
jgi:hypothetical protein